MINEDLIPTEQYRHGVLINKCHTVLKMDAGTHHIFNAFTRHAEYMGTLTETQKREYPLLDDMCAANDINPVGFLYFKNAMLFVLCDGPTYCVAASCVDGDADRSIHRVVCMEMMRVRNVEHRMTQDMNENEEKWNENVCEEIMQDPATKCIDPSDKDAVIRALRIEKNGLLCLIDGLRDDVECAHRNIHGALKHINSERVKRAKRALENVIECMGVKP